MPKMLVLAEDRCADALLIGALPGLVNLPIALAPARGAVWNGC